MGNMAKILWPSCYGGGPCLPNISRAAKINTEFSCKPDNPSKSIRIQILSKYYQNNITKLSKYFKIHPPCWNISGAMVLSCSNWEALNCMKNISDFPPFSSSFFESMPFSNFLSLEMYVPQSKSFPLISTNRRVKPWLQEAESNPVNANPNFQSKKKRKITFMWHISSIFALLLSIEVQRLEVLSFSSCICNCISPLLL